MVTARMTGAAAAPTVAGTGGMTAVRAGAAFLVVLAGMLALALLFGQTGWSWILVIGVGFLAGAIAGRARLVLVALLAVVAFHAIAILLDLPRDATRYWFIGAGFEALLLAVAFVVGVDVGWRRSPVAAFRDAWAGIGHRRRVLAVAVVVGTLLASVAYAGVIVAIGPAMFITPSDKSADCRTPQSSYGWSYEAINYDLASDASLRAKQVPENDSLVWKCSGTPAPAGQAVVTSDGIRLAGWYIPAANGAAATGPTLLLVHGWKDVKSGMLAFAAPLHADYNLVLFDLRNGGQSGGDRTSMGLWEQRDVTAMLDWLSNTKHPSWIGVVANSMGAATALGVAADDQRIRAMILDSMHADVVTSWSNAMEEDFGFPGGPAARVLATAVSMQVGGDITTTDPIRSITKLGDRPVLLTASLADQVDPPAEATERNFKAALDAGVPAEVQYCHGARHGQVIVRCADDWASWATSFLTRARSR